MPVLELENKQFTAAIVATPFFDLGSTLSIRKGLNSLALATLVLDAKGEAEKNFPTVNPTVYACFVSEAGSRRIAGSLIHRGLHGEEYEFVRLAKLKLLGRDNSYKDAQEEINRIKRLSKNPRRKLGGLHLALTIDKEQNLFV